MNEQRYGIWFDTPDGRGWATPEHILGGWLCYCKLEGRGRREFPMVFSKDKADELAARSPNATVKLLSDDDMKGLYRESPDGAEPVSVLATSLMGAKGQPTR